MPTRSGDWFLGLYAIAVALLLGLLEIAAALRGKSAAWDLDAAGLYTFLILLVTILLFGSRAARRRGKYESPGAESKQQKRN
ncbi:MAG: hypothetical protein ACLFUJ_13800 [Phycisphaerae bacterium]